MVLTNITCDKNYNNNSNNSNNCRGNDNDSIFFHFFLEQTLSSFLIFDGGIVYVIA